MTYRNTTLITNGKLQLIQSVKVGGRKKYIIKWHGWPFNHANTTAMKQLADPIGNRLIPGSAYMWKFNTRKEAEEIMSMAVLQGLIHV